MTTAAESAPVIQYTGPGVATELWGGTQANFLVQREGRAAREAAVLLNLDATRYLAELLGQEDTQDFREGATRIVGREVIREMVEQKGRLDSLTFVSASQLRENPKWVDAARSALAARAAQVAEEPPAESHGNGHH